MRCDNGPEFTSRHFLAWGMERKIELVHIEPGRPVQNAHVESFHGKLRDECVNTSWFGLWCRMILCAELGGTSDSGVV